MPADHAQPSHCCTTLSQASAGPSKQGLPAYCIHIQACCGGAGIDDIWTGTLPSSLYEPPQLPIQLLAAPCDEPQPALEVRLLVRRSAMQLEQTFPVGVWASHAVHGLNPTCAWGAAATHAFRRSLPGSCNHTQGEGS